MHKIRIENFGPITKAEIEIEKMVIFIGEQASGKSTISKLIYFFKSLKEDYLSLIIDNLEIEEDIRISFLNTIKKKFYNYFGSTKHLPSFNIKYFYTPQKTIELTLNPKKYLNIEFEPDFYKEIWRRVVQLKKNIKNPSTSKNNYDSIAIRKYNFRNIQKIKKVVDSLFEDDKSSLFVPAGRNITVTYSEQFKLDFFGFLSLESNKFRTRDDRTQSVDTYLMLEFLRKIEAIKDMFRANDFDSLISTELDFGNISKEYSKILHDSKEVIFEILKGKYVHDKFGEKIYYDTSKRRYVHLSNASSGQQEAIRILQDCFLLLLNKENVFRVIEEPEAHLYPLAQKKLIELLSMVIQYTDSEIIITTHSPYVLSVVNNLIFSKNIKDLVEKNNSQPKNKNSSEIKTFIDPSKFQAYGLHFKKEWECKSIFNKETQMIGENYLDEVSQIVGSEFNAMFDLYKELIPGKRSRRN